MPTYDASGGLPTGIKLGPNISNRFESRCSTVLIQNTDSNNPTQNMWFKDMDGSRLPIWLAHGEGRFIADLDTVQKLESNQLIPLRYADNQGRITENIPIIQMVL